MIWRVVFIIKDQVQSLISTKHEHVAGNKVRIWTSDTEYQDVSQGDIVGIYWAQMNLP